MLRQARERRAIGTREIADRLNWLHSWVNAIEADQYDALRNAAFARGYVKAYGRLLGLPETELLQEFDALQTQRRAAAPRHPVAGSAAARRARAQRQRVVTAIGLALVALLLLVAVLWWQHATGSSAEEGSPSAPATMDMREG